MMNVSRAGAVIAAVTLVFSRGRTAEAKGDKSPVASHVDVCLTSAVIAPTKNDGTPWDVGGKKLDAKQLAAVDEAFTAAAALLASNPATVGLAIAGVYKQEFLTAIGKPDVFGAIEMAPAGTYGAKGSKTLPIASSAKPVREFTPSFGTSVCFKDAKWSKDLRFRITLTDKDLASDDPIGTVEVISSDVQRAFVHQKAMHVSVLDQDTRQIKFVVLSVTKGSSAK